MDHYATHLTPTVTYTPTLTGGIGTNSLRRFYEQHFLRSLPPSMRLHLISRTVGVDRIVDELCASFEHTHEIPWMLPGILPTNRKVEIILVSIVSMKGGRLSSEHVYWDQASVLVQVGLLDPKLVPQGVQGVDRLPVVGGEAAQRMLREDPETDDEFHNRLIRRANAQGKSKGNDEKASMGSGVDSKVEATNNEGKGKSVQREGNAAGPETES